MQYISEETGLPVVIECRFCRQFNNKHEPATQLAGQWEGGDADIDPKWVPVCGHHYAGWFLDFGEAAHIPDEQRLPTFPLPVDDPEVIVYRGEDGYLKLVCPHEGCAGDDFYEADQAERWNPMELRHPASEFGNPALEPFLAVYEGRDGDGYQTDHHLCQTCYKNVTIPEWLETEWMT